ncbi:HAD family hydrolase [Nonomuraea basaltis]|uniref:HAD family hydrolase n=1 Tax=Nonomuraea basaltis TaxID=2495887 RepID=UPI00110C4276|nr:HAD family hydrolase [Nonomuraea basaltis]TMR90198.1 HAD family hydrolase [Nonomuraea basaltis]
MRRITHILFDFFGTLVEYSPSRTEQGYASSHALLRRLGATLTYEEFLDVWSGVSAEFDRLSDEDHHEFSMIDVGTAFLAQVLPRKPSLAEVEEFTSQYVSEWNSGVRYLPGLAGLIEELSADYRLAVVTNTHQPNLVPDHLAAMGLLSSFDAVITSVEVGWRKPHPKIFAGALDTLGVRASSAVFVGDTYEPDFEGPERAGMTAYLIDPHRLAAIPEDRRLTSVFDLPRRLHAQGV